MYETLGFWRAAWISPRWWMRKEYIVLVTELSGFEVAPVLHAARVQPRWAVMTEADLPALRAANATLSEQEIRRRWQEGQECVGGWVDGALAHYRWDTAQRTYLPYLKRTFQPARGDLLVWEAFTHPAFRGRGLHSLSTARALERARDAGYSRSLTFVAWWNAPALRVVQSKAGRVVAGTVGYWQLASWTRHFVTGQARLGVDGAISVVNRPLDRA